MVPSFLGHPLYTRVDCDAW